jgi:choline dehydrogenase-like flavoprotein
MVSRIEWDVERNGLLVAKRVEYFVNGNDVPQYADVNTETGGEVVLAAGTIGSPKIMEMSGVGNSRYSFISACSCCAHVMCTAS